MVVIQVRFFPAQVLVQPANLLLSQVLCSFRVFGNLAGFSSFKDISPTFQVTAHDKLNRFFSCISENFQRHLFGLSSIVSQSLPGIIIPAIMGIFGTTKHAQWKQQLPLNCSVVNIFNPLKNIYKLEV